MNRALFPLALLAVFALPSCAQTEPAKTTLFTSTSEVHALYTPGKQIWAATSGGVLRFDGKAWTKWTRETGLPSNEAFEIGVHNGKMRARFPLHVGLWNGEKWEFQSAPPFQKSPLQISRGKTKVRASFAGLHIGEKLVPLPTSSSGTHISAFSPRSTLQKIGVAIYGDGLWNYNGKEWARDVNQPPKIAREITAWSQSGKSQFLGTRRAGIFRLAAGKWTQWQQKNEIPVANIQFLAAYGDSVFASTLDDGLMQKSGANWQQIAPPVLSSSAPRQLFTWKNALWVRHGGGLVDSFDGKNWTKNALRPPRAGIYALAGDNKRIYASGWGGWSEWDGEKWESHYDLPFLKGVPILGITANESGETVWLQTQSRGVFRWTRGTRELRTFDERDGLEDDWITAFLATPSGVWAGTFVAGLAHFAGEKWRHYPELAGQNVTAILRAKDGVFAATRDGLWHVTEGGAVKKVEEVGLEPEIQSLCEGKNGIWIGGRTSLMFLLRGHSSE